MHLDFTCDLFLLRGNMTKLPLLFLYNLQQHYQSVILTFILVLALFLIYFPCTLSFLLVLAFILFFCSSSYSESQRSIFSCSCFYVHLFSSSAFFSLCSCFHAFLLHVSRSGGIFLVLPFLLICFIFVLSSLLVLAYSLLALVSRSGDHHDTTSSFVPILQQHYQSVILVFLLVLAIFPIDFPLAISFLLVLAFLLVLPLFLIYFLALFSASFLHFLFLLYLSFVP